MLVITGTGRSGTSAITLWLKKCGLIDYPTQWVEQFNSGLEPSDVDRVNSAIWIGNDAPMQSIPAQMEAIGKINYKIIKDPKFFYGNVLRTWIDKRKDLKFLICMRKFSNVHKSRIRVNQLNQVRTPEQLTSDFGRFLSNLIFNNMDYEIICYPDFIDQHKLVYNKIKKLDPNIKLDFDESKKVWEETMDRSMVHF